MDDKVYRENAKIHFINRCRERFGRVPTIKEIDKMRLQIKNNTAFITRDYGTEIRGVVQLGNINVVAVYDKKLDGMITVGVNL